MRVKQLGEEGEKRSEEARNGVSNESLCCTLTPFPAYTVLGINTTPVPSARWGDELHCAISCRSLECASAIIGLHTEDIAKA